MSVQAPPARGVPVLPPLRPKRKKRDSYVILSAFILVLFLLPARFVVVGSGAAGRPALLVGIGCFMVWLLFRCIPGRSVLRSQPMRWAVGIYLLIICASYLMGLDRGMPGIESRGSDREMLLTLSLVGVALAAMDGIPTREVLDRLLIRLVYGAGLLASVGAVQFLTGFDPTPYIKVPGLALNSALINVTERGTGGVPRVAGTAGHYIEFGVVLAMVLPIAIHYARYAATARQRQARWLIVVLMALGVPFSVSRAGVVAVALALILAAAGWSARTKRDALGWLFLGLIGLRVLRPGLLGTIRALFTHLDDDPSISGRTDDYALVGQYISERPWFGRGPGTFLPSRYVLLDNQWIGQTVATGYLGAAAFAVLFITALGVVVTIRHHCADERTRDLAQALAAGLVTGAVTSFFFDSMSFAMFSGVLFLLLGCVGALWQLTERRAFDRSAGMADERAHALLT